MNEELLTLQDLLATIKRHRLLITLVVLGCAGASVGVSKSLPKKFKSAALLNIQATYFEVPLLDVSIVGSRDAAEMQSQKQALLRLALNDEFLDIEGEKYKIFKSTRGTNERISEREGLRKDVDYFSSSSTTFQITGVGSSPEMAFGLASDALDRIVAELVNERQKSIRTYRESLRKQLESLGISVSAAGGSSAGARPQVLKEELSLLEGKLTALESQYNSNHPTVVAMRARIESVKQMLAQAGTGGGAIRETYLMDPKSAGHRSDFGEELLKKINYLDIALELEKDKKDLPYLEILERPTLPIAHFSPKTSAFGLGGLLAGILFSGLLIGFSELKRATKLSPQVAAKHLEVPFLGSMPNMIHWSPENGGGPGAGRR